MNKKKMLAALRKVLNFSKTFKSDPIYIETIPLKERKKKSATPEPILTYVFFLKLFPNKRSPPKN
jgi:hypothetical protein